MVWRGDHVPGAYELLIALNNVMYYKGGLLYYLPMVQKISFGYVLCWISLISLRLYRQSAKRSIN